MPKGSLSLFNFNAWLQSPEIVSCSYDFMDYVLFIVQLHYVNFMFLPDNRLRHLRSQAIAC